MAENIVRVDGWPVAAGTAHAFLTRLKPAFERAFPGITLHVYSGYRSAAEQETIFRQRYRPNAHSPYGDYRWWNGVRWGRTQPGGTVAVPGTSNHGSGHALDIRDSGSTPGVTRWNNARSNWIRANARSHGFNPDGFTFDEPWHITYLGNPWAGEAPAGTDQGGALPATSEEDEMAYPIKWRDHLYLVGTGFISHLNNAKAATLSRNIVAADDKWIGVSETEFKQQLDSFGIPQNVVDFKTGHVLDPGTGKKIRGGVWSWARAAFHQAGGKTP